MVYSKRRNTRRRNTRRTRNTRRKNTRRTRNTRRKNARRRNTQNSRRGRSLPESKMEYSYPGLTGNPGEAIVELVQGKHYFLNPDTGDKQAKNMMVFRDPNIAILQQIETPCADGDPTSLSETGYRESNTSLKALGCFDGEDIEGIQAYYGLHDYVFIKYDIKVVIKRYKAPNRNYINIPGSNDNKRLMTDYFPNGDPFFEPINGFYKKIFKPRLKSQERDESTRAVVIKTQNNAGNQTVHSDDGVDRNSMVFFYIFDYENKEYRQPFNIYRRDGDGIYVGHKCWVPNGTLICFRGSFLHSGSDYTTDLFSQTLFPVDPNSYPKDIHRFHTFANKEPGNSEFHVVTCPLHMDDEGGGGGGGRAGDVSPSVGKRKSGADTSRKKSTRLTRSKSTTRD